MIFKTLTGNCIRQHERQLPSTSYNYNTLTTLRTSVGESPTCVKSIEDEPGSCLLGCLMQLVFYTKVNLS